MRLFKRVASKPNSRERLLAFDHKIGKHIMKLGGQHGNCVGGTIP